MLDLILRHTTALKETDNVNGHSAHTRVLLSDIVFFLCGSRCNFFQGKNPTNVSSNLVENSTRVPEEMEKHCSYEKEEDTNIVTFER